MKPRHLLMGAALVATAGLVLFGETAPDTEVAEAVERAPRTDTATSATTGATATAAPAARAAAAAADGTILRLVPRSELIGEAGEAAFQGAGGIFGGQSLAPPPAVAAEPSGPPPPPPAPTAPPLPFTVIGKGLSGAGWEVYLANGERTYVAHAKEVIDGMYRIDAIAPPTLTITYLPLNQVQQLNIGVMD